MLYDFLIGYGWALALAIAAAIILVVAKSPYARPAAWTAAAIIWLIIAAQCAS